jgi:hypothetical protein
MKAVWLEEFGGPEVLVAAHAPDQRRYGARPGRTHHERTYENDEDNRR